MIHKSKKYVSFTYYPTKISIEDYDSEVNDDTISIFELEALIWGIKDLDCLQLMILRYLGYTYKEVIKIMHLKNVNNYYSLLRKLRKEVIEIKIKNS